jgi:diguanylate cyclase (GGDEF)-like protein
MTPLVTAVGVAFVATLTATVLGFFLRRQRGALDRARALTADALEQRLSVMEAVGDGMYIVDAGLRITHANEEAERLLRTTAGDLIGRRLDLVVDPLASELVPDIAAARFSGAPVQRTCAFLARQTWIEVRIQAAAHETLISLRDVSERTRAELRLRESQERLQLVTQHVDAVLWTTDREGRFTAIAGGALDDLDAKGELLVAGPSAPLIGRDVLGEVFAGVPARVERPRHDRWLRHHVEPMRDEDRNVVGAVGVTLDVTELKHAQEMLFDAAHHDRLTGLPNRLSLEQRLAATVAEAEREGRSFAVLFLDLDRFKTINDTLGHSAGDDVLREVASRLTAVVRGGDVVARPGGDEFIVLLPRVADAAGVQAVAQRMLRALGTSVDVAGRALFVSTSAGAALFPQHGTDAEALIAHADAAMYRAKGMGGNRYVLFEESMATVAVDRLVLEHDLRHAIDRGELELRFQPVVEVASGAIVGCESLVRWRHPERGLIMPDTFISIAEETGLIVAIDRWVLREACAAGARFRRLIRDFRIAVNVSSRDLREADLPDAIAQALADYELPAGALTVEVTESVALDESVLPVLGRLDALGVDIAIDDFGIGYSSLSYLKRLPVSVLKVDRCFVRDIAHDPYDQAIVASIATVARALGFRVIVEGIEDDAQLRRIADLGCDLAQGFRFGRPQTLEAFEASVRASRPFRPEAVPARAVG